MASMWRKTMVYLGLGPDEEYDDYDMADAHDPRRAPAAQPQSRPRPVARPTAAGLPEPAELRSPSVRPLAPVDAMGDVDPRVSRPVRPSAVRPIATPATKPHVVSPTSFNDVQEVADKFKAPQPVIVNLQGADRDLSRRLIDFASGLCYGIGGQMERVADQVYLLTPTDIEVSVEERRRLQERGLVDP